MCKQIINGTDEQRKMKPNYSLKKVFRILFKKEQQEVCNIPKSLESVESLENLRNLQMEQQLYDEIDENKANEKLVSMVINHEDQEVYVPVRFARTDAGTFFWTTNLQPVISSITPAADEDLLQPAYCYSSKQYPHMQFQDRWAQA